VDYNFSRFIPRLHDRANIQQKSSKCIQNARRLLYVCLMFASIHPASSTSYDNQHAN